MDELLALETVVVNGETVYVNRCGDLWRWAKTCKWSEPKFRMIDTIPRSNGYIHPMIGGKHVLQHRIIASAFLGLDMTDLKIQVDHRNGLRDDNRLENLRLVTNQQNGFNRTKAKGYHWNKNRGKWHTKIKLNGRTIHLGYFNTPDDARNAYTNAKLVYHQIPTSSHP
jgi:hypothetical protein